MTCGDGMAEGLGRVLKVAAIPPTPATNDPEEPFDPTISDIYRMEDLVRPKSLENLPMQIVEPREEERSKLPWTEHNPASAGTMPTDNITASEAEIAFAVKEKSMKWSIGVMFAALVVAVGFLGYDKHQADQTQVEMTKKIDGLTTYFIQKEFGNPEALKGKTYLEVTPEMREIGMDKFAPIAERLPYAPAETIKGLLTGGVNSVARAWNLMPYNNRAVVWLESAEGAIPHWSVLVHIHPTSVCAYMDAATNPYDNEVYHHSFSYREDYLLGDENHRLVAYAATMPTLKREELMELGDMNILEKYDAERVLFLVGEYGVGERFIHLSDEDYNVLALGRNHSSYAGLLSPLEVANYTWWRKNVKDYAEKMERESTAKK
ncbi:MAG: hypothetical protein Q7R85_00015 [bacterium]|nr:hypothetical protein [bacterium]